MPRMLVSLAAALGLAFALPAWAAPKDNNGPPAQPPGNDPCATGQANGNPCGGNNGNDKGVGNAQTPAQPEEIWCRDLEGCDESPGAGSARVLSGDGGAYITQIGDGNTAVVDQSSATEKARAVVHQDGEANHAEIRQSGPGGSVAELMQAGDLNSLSADQSGSGKNSLIAGQLGAGNRALIDQYAAGGVNAAEIVQAGDGNQVSLGQSGSGNHAVLTQNGAGNTMSASQSGGGNRLSWTQDGNNLPDLGVSQTGAMAISIYQSNGS